MAGSRNLNRASTVYEGADGYWHGRVTVGVTDDGSLDWRHVQGKSKGVVVAKVRELERSRERGQVARPGSGGRSRRGWSTGWSTSRRPN